jgi:hypothetical protein
VRLQRDAEPCRCEVGAEGKPAMHDVMSSCGGARLERRRRRSCCEAAAVCGGLPSPWAHVARAANEGSRSDAEAWRDEVNELKEAPAALGFGFRECVLSIDYVQGGSRVPKPNA